jgi:penicillin G amidase
VLFVLIGIPAALGARFWRQLRAGMPQLSGAVLVPGLDRPVRITRSRQGVPTIDATDAFDGYFALGYVHAQDRFFEMELARRAAAGRLSEWAGHRTVELDTFVRRLALRAAAAAAVQRLEPRTVRALEAYAAGVNAWRSQHLDALPPEMVILRTLGRRVDVAPWTPVDSIATLKLLALDLSLDFRRELFRAAIERRVGRGAAASLATSYGDGSGDVIAAIGALERAPRAVPPPMPPNAAIAQTDWAPVAARWPLPWLGASNAWVIAGARSRTGRPLLSNDPHMKPQNPSQWYLARIRTGDGDLQGATIPGIPAVIVGRNESIAWGVTNSMIDSQDLYIERPSRADPTHYRHDGHDLPFAHRQELIDVTGEDPITIDIDATIHGPVVDTLPTGEPLALRWTALDSDDTTMDAVVWLPFCRDWSSFKSRLQSYVAPAVNMVYADGAHIAYRLVGRVPIRRHDGSLPADGTDLRSDWNGYRAFTDLPESMDPASGYIVSANNRISRAVDGWSNDWVLPFRARRIQALLTGTPRLGLEEMRTIEADTYNEVAVALQPLARRLTANQPLQRAALRALLEWDLRSERGSIGAGIFVTWRHQLARQIFADQLGEQLSESLGPFEDSAILAAVAQAASSAPKPSWCDDVTTPAHESCDDIAQRAFVDAVAQLRRRQTDDLARWRLGDVVQLQFENEVAAGVPLLSRLFTRRVVVSGDSDTVHVAQTAPSNPFRVDSIPSLIVEADLSAPNAARFALPLGESAHPLSRHYDDLLAAWAAVEPGDVTSSSEGVLELTPMRPVSPP